MAMQQVYLDSYEFWGVYNTCYRPDDGYSCHEVYVPDVACSIGAGGTMEEALAAAKEKLTDMVSDIMYRGDAIPLPSLPADIINHRQMDNGNTQLGGFIVTFVGVVIVSTLPSLRDRAIVPRVLLPWIPVDSESE